MRTGIKLLLVGLTLFVIGLLAELKGSEVKLHQTRDDRTFTLTLELLPPAKVTEKCKQLSAGDDRNGCTVFNLDTKTCTIYAAPQRYPFDDQRLAVIGHEVWHCRYGIWHDPD